ncbi:MFS transporter [Salipaludibacillus agaradhaerens]|uniref:MFS transporter n=1 Tax=Salipaludibacillus agaradhaerens TaxID=76935 RepID=UPI00215165AC|nr:MFS transporter [Salipaludibacillus agaradhaerens]MCR6106362.1 MFS transporter [Salipaludibacillus agaradhaerens]MCR6118395.1 MFS transporter [Salipaludibacillus agaradhaerens]UJW57501.1 MFS transporter [Bacillus sp. A116_S68]
MKNLVRTMVGDIELNKEIKLLLLIGGLYALSVALSNTFVNVYLWKQSEDFVSLSIYNLFIVIMQPITFVLAGRWAKKIDRITVLRLGVIFLSGFYLTVLMLGENAGNYLVLLGILLGIGYGFYWLSFNVLTFEITEPETRDFFNGFLGLLNSFAGMIGPISAGLVITHMEKLTGYNMIFSLSLGLFVVAVILSFFLKRRPAAGRYKLLNVFHLRKQSYNWRRILYANFFQGLREGSFAFVVIVWVFVSTGSELAIGTYGLIASGISFISYYLVGRFLPKSFRKKAILVGSIFLYAAVFIIVFDQNFSLLITYGIVISMAYPLLLVPYLSITYDVIGSSENAEELRIEYIVIRELYLNGGRIISILVLLLAIWQMGEKTGIPFTLLLLGSGELLLFWMMKSITLPSGKKEQ